MALGSAGSSIEDAADVASGSVGQIDSTPLTPTALPLALPTACVAQWALLFVLPIALPTTLLVALPVTPSCPIPCRVSEPM